MGCGASTPSENKPPAANGVLANGNGHIAKGHPKSAVANGKPVKGHPKSQVRVTPHARLTPRARSRGKNRERGISPFRSIRSGGPRHSHLSDGVDPNTAGGDGRVRFRPFVSSFGARGVRASAVLLTTSTAVWTAVSGPRWTARVRETLGDPAAC